MMSNAEKQLNSKDLLFDVSNNHQRYVRKTSILKSSFPLVKDFKASKHNRKKSENMSISEVKDIEEVRSGWSSRRDSQNSVDDNQLVSKLSNDLKEYIQHFENTNTPLLLEKAVRLISDEKEVPSSPELAVKICSAHYMYNTIQNFGDQILIFDMRSMYNYLKGHVDFNHSEDSTIPLPCDYLLENNLRISDLYNWLPKILKSDSKLEHFNIINSDKL